MVERVLDLQADHRKIVLDTLRSHIPKLEVWAFGSRVKGTAKRYSDLDLAIITNVALPLNLCASLSDEFSDSDLPFKVDLVDWATTKPVFRSLIEQEKIVLQSGGSLT